MGSGVDAEPDGAGKLDEGHREMLFGKNRSHWRPRGGRGPATHVQVLTTYSSTSKCVGIEIS